MSSPIWPVNARTNEMAFVTEALQGPTHTKLNPFVCVSLCFCHNNKEVEQEEEEEEGEDTKNRN